MSKNNESNGSFSLEVQKWLDSFPVLSETDFYPPIDNRTLHSGVQDIKDGDCFKEYISEYNEVCDEEEIYDDNNDFYYCSSDK